jgi:hypothetical protein
MADVVNSPADDVARLEAALERIERAKAARPPGPVPAETARLAARLDALIGELRSVLKRDGAD